MNVEFINPFLEAIINVLKTMAMMDAHPAKPFVKKNNVSSGDVTGLIGMASEQAKGTLAVTFTDSVIIEVTRRMLGEEVTKIDDTVTDMVGEITNMVTGGAKRVLSEKGYKFDLAIPTVIAGKNHVIKHKAKGAIVCVPFETDAGSFFIEICFDQ